MTNNLPHIWQVLTEISQNHWESKEEDKEKIKEKEKRLLKKVICPFCGTKVQSLSDPCPVCKEIKQMELGERQ